jgi:hypothetical protein
MTAYVVRTQRTIVPAGRIGHTWNSPGRPSVSVQPVCRGTSPGASLGDPQRIEPSAVTGQRPLGACPWPQTITPTTQNRVTSIESEGIPCFENSSPN